MAVPAPESRCAVEDPRLAELSGLVADGGGLWAAADGGRRVEVHRLDPSTCAVVDTRTSDINPFDVEDLARGPDGSLWVGDLGDNERSRPTVAVVVMPARGPARLHRLTYPDGPHDAEALLVDPTGRPIVITKEVGGPAGLYRTAEPPTGTGPTALTRVGEVTLPASDTAGGPIGRTGSRVVTGAAASGDGRVVGLRSYTDAWLYAVPDGDPLAALGGVPVQVPLPDEPQGEAIAFEPDGDLVSGSETRGGAAGEIRAVPAAAGRVAGDPPSGARPAAPTTTVGEPGAPAAATPAEDGPAPDWVPAAIGGAVVVGVLVLLTAALALRRR